MFEVLVTKSSNLMGAPRRRCRRWLGWSPLRSSPRFAWRASVGRYVGWNILHLKNSMLIFTSKVSLSYPAHIKLHMRLAWPADWRLARVS